MDRALVSAVYNSSPRQKNHGTNNSPRLPEGTAECRALIAHQTMNLYSSPLGSINCVRQCVGSLSSAQLLETDQRRPATGAADIQPSQPTHRVLRCMFHRAFSYAVSTVP